MRVIVTLCPPGADVRTLCEWEMDAGWHLNDQSGYAWMLELAPNCVSGARRRRRLRSGNRACF